MPASPRLAAVAVLPLTVLALAACGSSSDGSTSTTSAASTPSTSTQAAAPAKRTLAAKDGKIVLTAKDFSFSSTDITAPAGKLTVSMENMGMAPHEFVVLKTSKAPGSLKVTNGRVAETDSVGEIAEIQGGKTGKHVFDLQPGKYVYVCNVPGHYGDGMRGQLIVQ